MKKINNILVPVDFSEASINALKYAVAMSREIVQARIVVLHSYHVPITSLETAYVSDQAILMEQMEKRAKEEMAALERDFLSKIGVPYELVLHLGPAMEEINELVEEHKVEMVIMSTQKVSKLEEVFGTLTTYAVRHCKAPLMIIPEDTIFQPVKKILFAIDLKKYEHENICESLKYLASAFDAEVVLLNVNKDYNHMDEEEAAQLLALDKEFVGLKHRIDFVDEDDVEEAILTYIKHYKIDLVTAVSRHHNFLEKLFKSSITKKLALHTNVPMLALHD